MSISHCAKPTILLAAWAASILLLWPQTVLSGYAGQQHAVEDSIGGFTSSLPKLSGRCREELEEWLRSRTRMEIAVHLPTAIGYSRAASSAERSYAVAACPSGPLLAAGAMARRTGSDARARAGLE